MSEYSVGFIGTGNIAGAIFSGIVNSGYIKPENCFVFDLDFNKTKSFNLSMKSYTNYIIVWLPFDKFIITDIYDNSMDEIWTFR